MTDEPTRIIVVSGDEVREVARLASRFCQLDERRRAGSVLVTDVLGAWSWLMGYSAGVISLMATGSTGDGDWVIPKRLIHAASILGAEEVSFREATDGEETLLTVTAGTSTATLPLRHAPEVELVRWANAEPKIVAAATLPVEALARLIDAARCSPHDVEEGESPPLFWVTLDDGGLAITIDWGPFGTSRYSALGQGAGQATTAANPSQLAGVLEVFEGDITIEMTADPDDVMILRSWDRRALVTPIETTYERLRGSVEAVLAQAFGDLVLRRDETGDYPIRRHGAPIYARLTDDQPARLRVFSVLLDGVDADPELYRELNELNTSVRFARLTWSSGRVYAEVDLVAATLDIDEVLVAVDRIARVSSEFIPTIGAFFGGVQPDAAATRWNLYRSTIIDAEIIPGQWFTLTGEGGVADWSLPDEAFIITACNPAGTVSTDEAIEVGNNELGYDIRRDGGRTIAAVGRSTDADHAEPSLLMWGLPIEAALFYGRKYYQDAIFRLTADEMALVSCVDDRRESWPRLGAPADFT